MSKSLKRIRRLLSSYLIASMLCSIVVFLFFQMLQVYMQERAMYQRMPPEVRAELESLSEDETGTSQRLNEIYMQYWPEEDYWSSLSILMGLFLSLVLCVGMAFLASRNFVRPIMSVANAALHISEGNLAVRAAMVAPDGALSELVQNFNGMADAIESSEHYRKEMLAAISHELRTPLTILRGRLHAICDGITPASLQEHHRLLRQTEQLVRLVEDLNTLALAEAGQLSLQCVVTDLGALVQELLPVHAERARHHGVSVETDIARVMVSVDRVRLQQVLANLVENTLRYGASGKYMCIRVAQREGRAILELEDRGPGLPPGALERLFEPFFRVDNSRSRATGGSGLGLAIVRMLVIMHEGHIEADNRPGGGAVFRISLPLSPRLSTGLSPGLSPWSRERSR